MTQDAQLYSTVSATADGTVAVHLGEGHPGFTDPDYRARRGEIAAASLQLAPGDPTPRISYTDAEHDIWAQVCRVLRDAHERFASAAYADGKGCLDLPHDHVPQLDEVTSRLRSLTGWGLHAAPGLVPLREFYSDLAARTFNSTQYLRHPSNPLYTPEPDIIHEVVGHANQLADRRLAALTQAAGAASERMRTERGLKFVADVFWFSLEFGVVREQGELKAYGAGILSSIGELEHFRSADIRPLDIAQMGTLPYDITAFQPVLYAADGMGELEDVIGGFFETADDALVESLLQTPVA